MSHSFSRLAWGAACGLLASTLAAHSQAQSIVLPQPELSPPARLQGSAPPGASVLVALTVTVEGQAVDAKLLRPGDSAHDAAALAAVSGWRFKPALRDGTPVSARIRVAVPVLGSSPEPTSAAPAAPTSVAPAEPVSAAPAEPTSAAPAEPAPLAASSETEVTVLGRLAPPLAAASDLRLTVGELSRVPRKSATELLKLAPGVYLSRAGGEGHAERIYLRGFDAREGQDVELSVGGVPINESGNYHGSGFADAGFIIPELVRGLRVVEGPFDVRQGNYAVAGSADYQLGTERGGLTAQLTLGSYGAERALVQFAPSAGATLAAAELYQTDGYGQNRDLRRARAMAQYEGRLGERGSYRLSGAAYGVEYHSAGVLRRDDVEAGRRDFFDTYDARQGGSGSRYHLSADLEQQRGALGFGQQLFVIRRSVRVRENLTGFLGDPQEAIQAPHGQRGDLLDLQVDETTYGGRGFARTSATVARRKQDFELGYYARGDDVAAQRQRIDEASVPYKKDVDQQAQLGNLALYAEAVLRPLRGVSLKGGVRRELFLFNVLDRCAVQEVSRPSAANPPGDASCLAQQRFGTHREPEQRSSTASSKLLPRATLTLGPFQGFRYFLAYGHGVRAIDPSYVSQDVATPFASIESADGGVSYASELGGVSIAARSVFFHTHVDRDLAFSETEGRSVLGGGTSRSGWNGLIRLRGASFDQSASASLVRSTFDDSGLLVPYAPALVLRSDSALFADLPVRVGGSSLRAALSLGVDYVGRRALPFGQRSEAVFTLDTALGLQAGSYALELEVTNLLDVRYRSAELNYASDFRSQALPTLVPARHFAAGAPREVFLSLAVTFGGEEP